MIDKTLEYLRANLNLFLQWQNKDANDDPSTNEYVVLNDISLLDGPNKDKLEDKKLIMSLVYTREEATLKNSSPYVVRGSTVEVRNPPVFLNLGMILCANYPGDYPTALLRLSEVVQFFQSKRFFTFASSPVQFKSPFNLTDEERDSIEVTVEMMQLSLEEINHLWGILRVRALPHVVYKIRLVQLEADRKIAGGGLVQEIQANYD